MTRTFTYRFEDGFEVENTQMNNADLMLFEDAHGKCTYNGWAEFMGVGQPSRLGVIGGSNTRGDGFKTGYNFALGMEIKSPEHYKKVLREKGMVEVGNESQAGKKRYLKSAIDEEVVSELKSMGAEIGDQAAEELMKPTEVVES
jgi:hypothetical protein